MYVTYIPATCLPFVPAKACMYARFHLALRLILHFASPLVLTIQYFLEETCGSVRQDDLLVHCGACLQPPISKARQVKARQDVSYRKRQREHRRPVTVWAVHNGLVITFC